MRQGRRGSIEVAGADGVSRFYAFAPWGSSGANEKYVVIGFPEESAIHALNATLAWNVAGLVGVIGVMAVFVNRASDALLVRPVRHLMSVTNRLTSGDLTVRASSLGQSELAGLAGSLNDLAEALDQRRRERDAADAALNEAQSRLTQIVETVPLGIFVTDSSGRPRLVNRAARAMFGTSIASLSLTATTEQLGLRHAPTGAPVTARVLPGPEGAQGGTRPQHRLRERPRRADGALRGLGGADLRCLQSGHLRGARRARPVRAARPRGAVPAGAEDGGRRAAWPAASRTTSTTC